MKRTVWLEETRQMRFDAAPSLGRPLQASYGRPNPLQADW